MKKRAKVPVILQMEAAECGAACLGMILASHRLYVPLEKLRVQCGVSRDGSNAANIVKAAQFYGLSVKAYKKEPEQLRQLSLPAIIHWNFNHFVVLTGFNKKGAVINDPACGKTLVPFAVLDKAFTGIVLCFEPGAQFEPGGAKRKVSGFLKERLKNNYPAIVFILLISLVTAVVSIVLPAVSRLFIDKVLIAKNISWLTTIVTVMGISALILAVALFLEGLYLNKLKAKLALTSDATFFWHMLSLPIEFFAQRYTGDLISRQDSNEAAAELLCKKVAPLVINMAMALIYLGIMLVYDGLLAGACILITALNCWLLIYSGKKRADDTRVEKRNQGQYIGVVASGIEMIETIKAGGMEERSFEKWMNYGAKHINSASKANGRSIVSTQAQMALIMLLNFAILFLGVLKILEGQFTIGILIAFQGFLSAFLSPVGDIVENINQFRQLGGHIERIEDVLNYQPEVDLTDNSNPSGLAKLSGNVEISGLRFSYSPLTRSLIEDFDLSIKRGQSIAIAGASGGGKSSVVKLIAGLYSPNAGRIEFDGHTRSDIARQVFSRSLAMVDQDIVMFEDSVLNNITMWQDYPFEQVLNAARDACIHEDIISRPAGYSAMILEGGKNFSGGQKQRLEIARALVKNPDILILDEATSALDAETEKRVMEAIKRRNITCIIVAHRLSTIRDCDEIIVLDKGKIVERGTHEQMKNANKFYTKLLEN